MTAVVEERVDVGGLELWTARQGSGPPLVLCHGGPGGFDQCSEVAEMVDDLATVYRFEQRGCHRSDAAPPYDVATQVADLEALRAHFGHERWAVGGHSWGATLALCSALEHPDRVTRLLYLSGTGIDLEYREAYHRAGGSDAEPWPEPRFEPNLEVNRAISDDWKRIVLAGGLEARVAALEVPALLVHGSLDIRPSGGSRRLAALLPRAEFALIDAASHFLWLERAEALRRRIRAFMADESLADESLADDALADERESSP